MSMADVAPLFSPSAQRAFRVIKHSKQEPYAKWEPLFIVLVILGVIGLGVSGVGFAKLGRDLGWWSAGGVSNLGQIHSLIVMAAGFLGGILCLIPGIIGLIKINKKKEALSQTENFIQMTPIEEEEVLSKAEFKVLEEKGLITGAEIQSFMESFGQENQLQTKWESILKHSFSRIAYIKDRKELIAFARIVEDNLTCFICDFTINTKYQQKGAHLLLMDHLLKKMQTEQRSEVFLILGNNHPETFKRFYENPEAIVPESIMKVSLVKVKA